MTKARTLADNFAADINGITAGTGITGGGTSGTVTVTNSMATAIDAKGDLVVGTGADTFSRLAVASTAGYLLSVDSGETTGLKWAAPAGGGKVLQVVSATTSTSASTATNVFLDTNLTATITPASASNKVLVLVSQNGVIKSLGNAANSVGLRLVRGATTIFSPGLYFFYTGTAIDNMGGVGMTYLDSPSTTSSTTYKTQFNSQNNSATAYVQDQGATSSIVLLEIEG